MIKISSYYGESASSKNHAKMVSIGDTTLYFSYETLVGIRHDGKLYVIANMWGPTTGKHLNILDGGSKEAKNCRLTQDEFDIITNSLVLRQVLCF